MREEEGQARNLRLSSCCMVLYTYVQFLGDIIICIVGSYIHRINSISLDTFYLYVQQLILHGSGELLHQIIIWGATI